MSTLDKNTDPKVDTVGNNIYIVDPNPPEMDMHPPEDMFIYVCICNGMCNTFRTIQV